MMSSSVVCLQLKFNDLHTSLPFKVVRKKLLCSARRGTRTEALSTWPRQLLLQHLLCLPSGMGLEHWRERDVKGDLYRRDLVVRACFCVLF